MEEIGVFLVCGVIGFVTSRVSVVLRHRLYGNFDEILPTVIILGAIALYLSYGAAPYIGNLASWLQALFHGDIDFSVPEKGVAEKLTWRDIDAMFFALPVAILMAFVIDSAILFRVYLMPSDLPDSEIQNDFLRLLFATPLIFLILLSPLILFLLLAFFLFYSIALLLMLLVSPFGKFGATFVKACYWEEREEALGQFGLILLEDLITEEGDDFYRLQLEAARDRRLLLVTLTNDRVYYGMPLLELRHPQLILSHGASRHLQLELYFSGYRDEAEKAVHLTAVYPRQVDTPDVEVDDSEHVESSAAPEVLAGLDADLAAAAAPGAELSGTPQSFTAAAAVAPAPAVADTTSQPEAVNPAPRPISLLEIPYSQIVSLQLIEHSDLLSHALGTEQFYFEAAVQDMVVEGATEEQAREIVARNWTPGDDLAEARAQQERARYTEQVQIAVDRLTAGALEVLNSARPPAV